ncbi:MAG: hypothetical protein JO199_13485 [Candidatus Eremiobacteraeota bacterium]|nr:hypothetical protein [Candidatus Eremiobacteraeota bacterium]
MNFSRRIATLPALLLAACGVLAACTSSTSGVMPHPAPTSTSGPAPVGNYIKHVVVIVQENRSFENMFAGWPGADAPLTGKTSTGRTIALRSEPFSNVDICHIWSDAMTAWDNGKMDGFDKEGDGSCVGPIVPSWWPYTYLDHRQIAPYRLMASRYVLAYHMFPTEFGTSLTAHQALIAGTTRVTSTTSLVNVPSAMPWGCDAPPGTTTQLVTDKRVVLSQQSHPGPFPCMTTYPTMADVLDAAHQSWKYYAPPLQTPGGQEWTGFDAIAKVRCASFKAPQTCLGTGSDWKNVVTPETQALKDFTKGDLPAVSWVIPDLLWADYPAVSFDYVPSWVGDLVNAIGKSKDWNSTAIVILWDDWGGWYDNAPPPQLDYEGLAIRVPCIIVSPYAKHGYVDSTQYEYGSILKFVEQAFNLGSLHTTDERAASLVNAFDFTQKPRAFTAIPTKYPPSFFYNSPQSVRPPDND